MPISKYSSGKKKFTRKTRLIFTEGLHEEMFLKLLQFHYGHKKVSIKIKKGRGGSPEQLVIESSRLFGEFNERVVVFDIDKTKTEIDAATKKAKELSIVLVKNFPCLDSVLLAILDSARDYSNKKSEWCKKEFQDKYIPKGDRDDLRKYKKVFPINLLDKRRKNYAPLDIMINLIESKKIKYK